jgi:uncharacterized protein involved in exopolysaccharide biosynthesis
LFYADLVRTNRFLRDVAQTSFTFLNSDRAYSGSVITLYEIDEGAPDRTLFEAVRLLREELIAVRPNRQTSVVTVEVRTRWPQLSKQMSERILQLVNRFNLESRNTQAGAERDFVVGRLDTAVAELRGAENRLQQFLQRNREFRTDPALQFEHDRLMREMNLRQQIYTTLVQSYEQARIEAVRNTPSITVVDPPSQPLRGDSRRTPLKGIVALLFGAVLALAYVFVAETIRRAQGRASGAERLESLWADAQRDLGPIGRLLPRRWRIAR